MQSLKVIEKKKERKKQQLLETMSRLLRIIHRPQHQEFSYRGYFFSYEEALEVCGLTGTIFPGKTHCRVFSNVILQSFKLHEQHYIHHHCIVVAAEVDISAARQIKPSLSAWLDTTTGGWGKYVFFYALHISALGEINSWKSFYLKYKNPKIIKIKNLQNRLKKFKLRTNFLLDVKHLHMPICTIYRRKNNMFRPAGVDMSM